MLAPMINYGKLIIDFVKNGGELKSKTIFKDFMDSKELETC